MCKELNKMCSINVITINFRAYSIMSFCRMYLTREEIKKLGKRLDELTRWDSKDRGRVVCTEILGIYTKVCISAETLADMLREADVVIPRWLQALIIAPDTLMPDEPLMFDIGESTAAFWQDGE